MRKLKRTIFLLSAMALFVVSLSGCAMPWDKNPQAPGEVQPGPVSVEEEQETEIEDTFRLDWMDISADEASKLSDKELISLYIDIKLFEQEYRNVTYETLMDDKRVYITASYLHNSNVRMDYNGTIDGLIINSRDHDSIRNYFDFQSETNYVKETVAEYGFSNYSDYLESLENNIPEGFVKEDVIRYIDNFYIDAEGYPCFKNRNLIVDISYLNDKIFPITKVEPFAFKLDLYNNNFTGGRD